MEIPVKVCIGIREEPMKIARFMSFTLAAAAMVLHVGAAQAAMKTQWIDYKQGNTALSAISSMTMRSRAGARCVDDS